MFNLAALSTVFIALIALNVDAFQPNALTRVTPSARIISLFASTASSQNEDPSMHDTHQSPLPDRRDMLKKASINLASAAAVALNFPESSNAMNSKNRSEGYAVQHTEREWAYMLSGKQDNILREGGTERPNSSILEGEERDGIYRCAGCSTPLFESKAKFHSGTGWPSFATPLAGVETENVNPVQAGLLGAEVRCGTCGGHLGDVFSDGMLFVNTPAFASGKRYCVDGAALIFKPSNGEDDVFGDLAPPAKKNGTGMPDFLSPPKINAR